MVNDTHGGLNRGTEAPGVDHGWLTVSNVNEQVYMWSYMDNVYQVKMMVEQVKRL